MHLLRLLLPLLLLHLTFVSLTFGGSNKSNSNKNKDILQGHGISKSKSVTPEELDEEYDEEYDDYMDSLEDDLKSSKSKASSHGSHGSHLTPSSSPGGRRTSTFETAGRHHNFDINRVREKESIRIDVDKKNCPEGFLNRCLCGWIEESFTHGGDIVQKRKFLVNCTNTGFTDPAVLSHLPNETGELIFTGNQIKELPPNLFGVGKEFPHLRIINLSNNGLRDIKGKAFHHVLNVERLILNHNSISESSIQIHPRVFSNFANLRELHLTDAFQDIWMLSDLTEIFIESNLTKLMKLHLEQNKIELITNSSIFCELPSLIHLYLSNNHLTDINIDVSCFSKLTFIDAEYNRIKNLGETSGIMQILRSSTKGGGWVDLNLQNNPIQCDCTIDPFLTFLRKWSTINPDRIRYQEHLMCKSGLPRENRGLLVIRVNQTRCAPLGLTTSDHSSTVTTGLVWFLCTGGFLLILILLFSKRASIFRQVQPLINPIESHGVKYTSINKNEEAEVAHV